jgi:hypothetical protein
MYQARTILLSPFISFKLCEFSHVYNYIHLYLILSYCYFTLPIVSQGCDAVYSLAYNVENRRKLLLSGAVAAIKSVCASDAAAVGTSVLPEYVRTKAQAALLLIEGDKSGAMVKEGECCPVQ